jgi:hypothetical protein
MTLTSRDRRIQREACPGCHLNRYNMGAGYRETERDAVVTAEKCFNVDSIPRYNRATKCFECGLNRTEWER